MRQSLAYDEDVGEFSPPSATNENLTCDFLVAGGGLSGLSAADAAIRRGLNVVVIEKGVYGKEAVMACKRIGRRSAGCGRSCAAPSRDASSLKSLIATTTSALRCNMGRARRPSPRPTWRASKPLTASWRRAICER